jgi:hypothetical protein
VTTEMVWLIVLIVFGGLALAGWVQREAWIHRWRRRRRQRRDGER